MNIETKGYDYKGYRIYNNGYGFDIYKNLSHKSILIQSNIESSNECEEIIDELINKDKESEQSKQEQEHSSNDSKSIYLIGMFNPSTHHLDKILHIVDNHLRWFLGSSTSPSDQKTMLKFSSHDSCKKFIEKKKYDSSLTVQYGIIEAKIKNGIINFASVKVDYCPYISMKGDIKS